MRTKWFLGLLFSLTLMLGLMTGMGVTASADEEYSEYITTNTRQTGYTGEHFKISVDNKGNDNGFILSSGWSATIEALHGEIISKVEFTQGQRNIEGLNPQAGTVTINGNTGTVSGVEAERLTVGSTKSPLYIRAVKIYYYTADSSLPDQNHDGITFRAWPLTNRLPGSAGNYYLTEDVTISSAWNAPSGTVNLCLNGHGIRRDGGGSVVVVPSGSTLNLFDCGTATHKYTVTDADQYTGSGLAVVNDSLSGGYSTFTGGYITGGNEAEGYGGAVDVCGGTLNVSGCTLIGNSAWNGGAVSVGKNASGGNASFNGTAIIGNTGNTTQGYGGGIFTYYSSADSVTLRNCTVTKNKSAYGGGMAALSAPITIDNSTIAYNSCYTNIAGIFDDNSVITVVGNVQVNNNYNQQYPNDLYLQGSGALINVVSMDPATSIAVLKYETGVITNGLAGKGGKSNFISDCGYGITLTSDGEAKLETIISQTVTFKVVNGAWNDATTADKTVNVVGCEGETLYLSADQIPTAGNQPNDTYKAGSWDVTPSTETAITEATTFTYTYAAKTPISQTVTFKVANGAWNDASTADKTVTLTGYEGDTLKLSADQIPAVGNRPNGMYKAGGWDVTPSTETAITEATTFTYSYAAKAPISQTVTFKVANGAWNDASTADKTVTLTGFEGDALKLSADQIPAVGNRPNSAYKAGSWDVTPSTETAITEATTFTYTYAEKEAAVVTKTPAAKALTYNGQSQKLVTEGSATGGTIQYALGTSDGATEPYSASIPSKTDVGVYYVWYMVRGDEYHNDLDAQMIEVTIAEPAFGTPDFTLPTALTEIEEEAFEGAAMKIVYVPDTCIAIGKNAFRGCTDLMQIRLPRNCAISDTAFTGCTGLLAIYAPAGGTTETWCTQANIPFVAE